MSPAKRRAYKRRIMRPRRFVPKIRWEFSVSYEKAWKVGWDGRSRDGVRAVASKA